MPRPLRINDLVMVRYDEVQPHGAYVSLIEYDDRRAYLPIAEFSRRRLRSERWATVGALDVMAVWRLDGDVDMTRKNVSPEEVEATRSAYFRRRTVDTIFRAVWGEEDFTQARDDLSASLPEDADVFSLFETGTLPADLARRDRLVEVGARHIPPRDLRAFFQVEVTCFGPEGIDGVRGIPKAGLAAADGEVSIRLKTSPIYDVVAPNENVADVVVAAMLEAVFNYEWASLKVRRAEKVIERGQGWTEPADNEETEA